MSKVEAKPNTLHAWITGGLEDWRREGLISCADDGRVVVELVATKIGGNSSYRGTGVGDTIQDAFSVAYTEIAGPVL
jgi:hypothetical protein